LSFLLLLVVVVLFRKFNFQSLSFQLFQIPMNLNYLQS